MNNIITQEERNLMTTQSTQYDITDITDSTKISIEQECLCNGNIEEICIDCYVAICPKCNEKEYHENNDCEIVTVKSLQEESEIVCREIQERFLPVKKAVDLFEKIHSYDSIDFEDEGMFIFRRQKSLNAAIIYCNENRDELRFANSYCTLKQILAYNKFDRKLEKLQYDICGFYKSQLKRLNAVYILMTSFDKDYAERQKEKILSLEYSQSQQQR